MDPHPHKPRAIFWALALPAVMAVAAAGLYGYVRTGGITARRKPTAVEGFIAQKLLQLGLRSAANLHAPALGTRADSTAIAEGEALYRKHCETCHGVDGKGTTAAGSGLYPPPLDLSRVALAQRQRTEGQLFYVIRNGIRNTGMPAWSFPDRDIWNLFAFVRRLPVTASPAGREGGQTPVSVVTTATYVGSQSCAPCHHDIYERWRQTPMANVVRDPREHPNAVLGDFSKADPLVTFSITDVALVYGSRWKQRYFKKQGDDYVVFPAQWDVTHKAWKKYFAKDDWWSALYPPDNAQRPTSALCDGCHSVNFDLQHKTVTEWNVGCERCHGPGSEHVKRPLASNIANAGRVDSLASSDVCIQCHSQGRPLKNPLGGKYYDWPVGYEVTKPLTDYWRLESHKLGETTFTHFADGTAHKNRMQGNDFVTSEMYLHGVTCFTCHDAHGTNVAGSLRKEPQALCLQCHGPGSPNGPRSATLAQHTHHPEGSAGNACIACHMPKVEQTLSDVNVRSHTFRFVSPSEGELLKIPNACNVCHADKSAQWATDELTTWAGASPWRLGGPSKGRH